MPSTIVSLSPAAPSAAASIAMKTCDCPDSCSGYRREIVRRLACGECRADHVEEDREAGALPEADRQKTLRPLDRRGVAREPPFLVVAAVDGKLLAAHPVHGERTVRELRHRDVEHDVSRGARHGDDERVVADEGHARAPRGHVGERVGPADADDARIRRLPSVVATAHPVVAVAESHRADAVLARELDRARHAGVRIEIARSPSAVPPLQRAERRDAHGPRVDIDHPVADHRDESAEAIQSVRRDAVATRVGEQLRAVVGARGLHPLAQQDVAHRGMQLGVGNEHGRVVGGRWWAVGIAERFAGDGRTVWRDARGR